MCGLWSKYQILRLQPRPRLYIILQVSQLPDFLEDLLLSSSFLSLIFSYLLISTYTFFMFRYYPLEFYFSSDLSNTHFPFLNYFSDIPFLFLIYSSLASKKSNLVWVFSYFRLILFTSGLFCNLARESRLFCLSYSLRPLCH